MRRFIKRVVSSFLVPATKWYLRKPRSYRWKDITVSVQTGVFHPGLFHSTKFLLSWLGSAKLTGTSLLELGCGTGLIAVFAARSGARVTAIDLSQAAVQNAKLNAQMNEVTISVIHSDLFQNIPAQTFDWIIINPPYYPRMATTDPELAWHCGLNFDYFERLFLTIKDFMSATTQVIIVLTRGISIEKIETIALKNGLDFELLAEHNVLFDGKDFLFRIKKVKA